MDIHKIQATEARTIAVKASKSIAGMRGGKTRITIPYVLENIHAKALVGGRKLYILGLTPAMAVELRGLGYKVREVDSSKFKGVKQMAYCEITW